ncbi:competence/damage-inducible protein cina-like protein [Halogeometricum pallidum JCM 14848]|uniref:Competence/damage-inducible protein cina-like protein n=1 Tax=Halogeometricum pallidum JCM 14848 TaxID=1227487 RepID=M0CZ55_HALPD|nr:CinA family protein [Halogeometricum pallidum]ELZ27179.1 competence/damage-inducible protein cina-like protein [Halogeometricum pallidum JCM 14848]
MREFADDPPVEERLGDALRDAEETLAVAESCTGGLVGSLLTDVPGSSDYFDRSVVTYSYEAKLTELAVSRESLDERGAVSEPVAREMAAGVRDTAGTDWGVATTGIAGPGGGTDEKPVGTVYVGVAYRGEWGSGESYTTAARHEFDGDRVQVKERFARAALKTVETAVGSRRV